MALQDTIDSLSNLDPDNIGSWPIVVKLLVWLLVMVVAGFGVYQFILADTLRQYERKQQKEAELMQAFEQKAFQAANLDRLKTQMAEMESSFGALVRQLPSDTEVPGLLEDISQLGVDSGLEFGSIGLQDERVVEFYAELPIQITVKGSYHSIGNFISGVAALPRIVTLHDFSLAPPGLDEADILNMSILAKTYRYNDREE